MIKQTDIYIHIYTVKILKHFRYLEHTSVRLNELIFFLSRIKI